MAKRIKNASNLGGVSASGRKQSIGDDAYSTTSKDVEKKSHRSFVPGDTEVSIDDEGLSFDVIPAMSNDGMYIEGEEAERMRNNELLEDEHEDMILDRASDYKMVSIMRQKRPAVVKSDDFEESKLSRIEEEESFRWTAALPKFG